MGDDVVSQTHNRHANITRLRKKIRPKYSNNLVTRQGFGYGFKGNELSYQWQLFVPLVIAYGP